MGAIFGFSGFPDADLTECMANALHHRGRKGQTVNTNPSATLGYLQQWEQPLPGAGLYCDGDQTIVLAGHVTSLGKPPSLPQLLEAYRERGLTFLEQISGSFVLAIRDRQALHLARDGAGVRTLYYALHNGRLLFGSEPKAIWQVPGFPRRLRPGAVVQYLTFSFIPGSATMLEDVRELLPGHCLTFKGPGEPSQRRFFVFEEVETSSETSEDAWTDHFRQTLQQAVTERLPRGEPVGVFLSGGLDSSVITAEVARQYPRQVKTYAIHFGHDYPNELEFARAVADRCRTEHEEVLIRPKEFLPRLRQIVWHLDEPVGDPITVPNFELADRVSRDLRWVFNGEGGDPCFGGPKNLPMMLEHWYGGVPREKNFREKAYLASYRRCYDDLHRLLSPEFMEQVDLETDLEAILTPFFTSTHPVRFLDKLAAINIRLKGAHLILPKVERMTGAWGILPQAPLFDEDILRFSFQMPAQLRLAGGVEKVVLKRAYAADLPREVIDRPKSGMRVPVHFWFQNEMRRYARHILDRRTVKSVGIFNAERVKQLLDYNIEEGPGRYGLRLWMLITFELWRRIVIEGEAV